jgi:hypothetical protein
VAHQSARFRGFKVQTTNRVIEFVHSPALAERDSIKYISIKQINIPNKKILPRISIIFFFFYRSSHRYANLVDKEDSQFGKRIIEKSLINDSIE